MGLWSSNAVGQVTLKTEDQVLGYVGLPVESTYVHSNGSFFLTGEYLYYKVYCFEGEAGDLTTLSKVAYVELVGKGGKRVFRHKIRLHNGQGHGDFFIPTEVASGSYKLIAYTNWMSNQTAQSFYQKNIAIVNPYRSNQPELQKRATRQNDSLEIAGSDTLTISRQSENTHTVIGPIQMNVSATHFSKRAKVTVSLNGKAEGQRITGNYSLSVRKKDIVKDPNENDIANVFLRKNKSTNGTSAAIGDNVMLPELRGELFQGKVVAMQDDKPVNNLIVAISIAGENYVFEVVQTDAQGIFRFNVAKSYSTETLFLQVLSQEPGAYEVQISEPKTPDYTKLDLGEVHLNYSMREDILRRSVHNQIENSYFQFRPDSIMTVLPKHFLDSKEKKTYLLDDYTRFKTLRETLVEIVPDVFSKRIVKDNFVIRVVGYDYASTVDIPPFILLDGCLIQDHNALLEFDTRTVEEISVFRDKFIFGPEIYEGALVLKTKDGNGYEAFQRYNSISAVELLRPQPDKKYFVQRYDIINANESVLKLPDDRLQLLWVPDLKIAKSDFEIDFFTSDVSGEFEISLEGVTEKNQPVSIRKSFRVE